MKNEMYSGGSDPHILNDGGTGRNNLAPNDTGAKKVFVVNATFMVSVQYLLNRYAIYFI